MRDVEGIWTEARNKYGQWRDRTTPSYGISAVVIGLYYMHETYGCELARVTSQEQGNVSRWLDKLGAWHLVTVVEREAGRGHQGGGHEALWYQLTREGTALAEALILELDEPILLKLPIAS